MVNFAEIKLCNAAWGFRKFSLQEFFEASARIGISAVEIHVGQPATLNTISLDATPEKIAEVKEIASTAGVKVAALAAGAVLVFKGEVVEEHISEVMKVIDLADDMDARVIRVFTGAEGLPPERITSSLYKRVSDAFNELGKYAHEKNVFLGIENHGGLTSNGEQIKKLLDMIPYEEVGVNYDPANFAYVGTDPYEALLPIQDRIVYTHWKDVIYTDKGPEYCALGEGDINWHTIIGKLMETYEGLWSIEYENIADPEDGTRRSLKTLQKIVEKIRYSQRRNDDEF